MSKPACSNSFRFGRTTFCFWISRLPGPLRQSCRQFGIPHVSSQDKPRTLSCNHPRETRVPRANAMTSIADLSNTRILALSNTWVAVNKPAGVLVHRTKLYHANPGERYLVDEVAETLSAVLRRSIKLLPVQRLDRPTSGVILFALDQTEHASMLQAALQSEVCEKQYWALAFGADMPVNWTNDHPLRDLSGKDPKQRPARTRFEQLLRFNESNISVVRARIETGRRHQVRRHLSNSRHPVLGDTSHGKGSLNRIARERFGVQRCCLHSRRVRFADPATQQLAVVEAPVPEDLRDVLSRFPEYDCEVHANLADLGPLL